MRDNEIYAGEKAKNAGVAVEHHHFSDMIHTFMNMEDLVREECDLVYRTISHFLNN